MVLIIQSGRFGPELPPQGGLVAWFRGDDVAGADNDAVSAWNDRTANAYNLSQGTGVNQPTKQTNELNGQTIVRFDGSNDSLTRAATPALAFPLTYVVIAKLTDATDGGANKHLIGELDGNCAVYHRFAGAGIGAVSLYAGTEVSGTTVPNGSTWYVYEGCFNRIYSGLRLGYGRPEITAAFANDPGIAIDGLSTGFFVGGLASAFCPCDVAEVLVYDHRLRDAERHQLSNYAFNRYGVGASIGNYATSYGNEGGTGYRVGEPHVTTTATPFSSSRIFHLLDSDFAGNTDGSWAFGATESGREIVFDFGAGARKIIDEFTWYQSASSASHGVWDFQGSNNGSSWTTIISGLTLGGALGANIYGGTNTTGYQYYRLLQTSGTTSTAPWINEIEFKISKASDDTATSFWNSGGKGCRNALITVTSDDEIGSTGTVSNFVDGGWLSSAADSWDFTSWTGTYIRFDFGVGASKIIDAFVFLQNSASISHGTWKFQGSNNASDWTDVSGTITLGGYYDTLYNFSNTTGYRYYQLVGVSPSPSAVPWLHEFEFKIKDA